MTAVRTRQYRVAGLSVLVASLACAASGGIQTAGTPAPLAADLDAIVQRLSAADSFSGAVLVARGSSLVYQRAVGIANRQTSTPNTVDTRLQMASVTKLLTSIAIRQLEQAGRLRLSDTLGAFLPAYPNARARSRVTVQQLLEHRSGVGSFFNSRFVTNPRAVRTVDDYIALFREDSLLFEPGTQQVYSNGGYVLLGAIIEKLSGVSYHEYVRNRILVPAGMQNTMPYDSRTTIANAAIGYTGQTFAPPSAADQRLAGPGGPRPGYEPTGAPVIRRPSSDSAARSGSGSPPAGGQQQMRLVGPDGNPMTPEQIAEIRRQRAAAGNARQPNSQFQPGMSSPAGDYYSTVGDFWKLASAIQNGTLLDVERAKALLGARWAAGDDFRSNGGGPGVNAEFSIFPNGYVMIVLSNYDPPAGTTVAQAIRPLLAKR